MAAEAFPELYGNYMMELRLPLPPDDMLGWIAQSDVSSCELDRIADLLSSMVSKKNENAVTTLKKLSRIPQKSPLTFDNLQHGPVERQGKTSSTIAQEPFIHQFKKECDNGKDPSCNGNRERMLFEQDEGLFHQDG